MDRRALLFSGTAVALASVADAAGMRSRAAQAAAAEPASAEAPAGWRRFEITTRVTLLDGPGAAQLWLPMAQDAGGYQAVLQQHWQGTGRTEVLPDAKYGAGTFRATWDGGSGEKAVEMVQVVAARDRDGGSPVLPVTEAERRFWTQPTESVPLDGIVQETTERITHGIADPRKRLRAIYDWVVDNTSRNPETPGCGFGDFKSMLESGNLSGKCADINGLMTGLARAAGFPARDVYGIRVGEGRWIPWLGAGGNVSKAQHCRCEAYLDGTGWFPLDPADVRKAVLEQKLALDSAAVREVRERLFGGWEGNWVGYNSATDIVLPGAGPHQKPNFAFLMYPCAFTATGQPDCLDPGRFRSRDHLPRAAGLSKSLL